MTQYLPEEFDIEGFDFRAGKNIDAVLKRRKRRKEDFNYGKDFNMLGNHIKSNRQIKKAKESINVNVLNSKDVEGEKTENAVVRPSM